MTLTQDTLDLIEKELKENPTRIDEAIKYLAELKYPVAPPKFDPTGSINQYHEAKRQGIFHGAKMALTTPSIYKSAGLSSLKGEEWVDEVKKIVKNIGEGEPVSFGNYHKGACYIKMKSGNRYVISIRSSQQMTFD